MLMGERAVDQRAAQPPAHWGSVGGRSTHDGDLVKAGDWKEFPLLGGTGPIVENLQKCPTCVSPVHPLVFSLVVLRPATCARRVAHGPDCVSAVCCAFQCGGAAAFRSGARGYVANGHGRDALLRHHAGHSSASALRCVWACAAPCLQPTRLHVLPPPSMLL